MVRINIIIVACVLFAVICGVFPSFAQNGIEVGVYVNTKMTLGQKAKYAIMGIKNREVVFNEIRVKDRGLELYDCNCVFFGEYKLANDTLYVEIENSLWHREGVVDEENRKCREFNRLAYKIGNKALFRRVDKRTIEHLNLANK